MPAAGKVEKLLERGRIPYMNIKGHSGEGSEGKKTKESQGTS